ncbi:efflux RND transporter periplasmic adaptor subunit [bacterium]|nr:efflux RND transporter periplasmic adaptor subunit [bacterium]
MTSKRLTSLTQGTVAMLAVLLLAGCSRHDPANAENKVDTATHRIAVEAVPVVRQTLTVEKTYTGSLEGESQANLVAKISERIVEIKAHGGSVVQKGQTIIVLDKAGPSSNYYQAEANYRNSEKMLARMKSLLAEGAISQQALDEAQTAFDVAKANFEGARSIVELSTPISGVVTSINMSIGDLTSPGAVLATVADIGRMKVVFSMNETDVSGLTLGQSVVVYSDSRSDIQMKGTVSEFYHSADTQSRSFEVKALFANTADNWFKPGMFVKIKYSAAPRTDVLVIPNAAILSDGAANRVFVLRDGRALLREITMGITDGQDTEILHGLDEHDSVALTGATLLRDSSLITLTQPTR